MKEPRSVAVEVSEEFVRENNLLGPRRDTKPVRVENWDFELVAGQISQERDAPDFERVEISRPLRGSYPLD